ncbi:MAG TPA: DUF2169 domain-containing protein [Gammaproteobacteria bacterium]|nr:DUF2169 domain-containing protein [Gammaproteobacteria bacterium]
MELINATKMNAGYNMGMDPHGREHLVVIVKGTYDIPHEGHDLKLAEEQMPLIEADTFTGERGLSAPIYESDYALFKPYCDVMLHGKAYALKGKPVSKLKVRMVVGTIDKSFFVLGDRSWQKTLFIAGTIAPNSFIEMPVSYDYAFGGMDKSHPDEEKHTGFTANPAGKGFAKYRHNLEDVFLPNTEEIGNPVIRPSGKYKPMAFGPLGRGWKPRYKWAGTYDDNWLDNVFPFLPADFDNRYYQAAPPDQQMAYPVGGEVISLQNLTPEGFSQYRLPKDLSMPVEFNMKNYEKKQQNAVVDTIYIEPDNKKVILVWRTSIPLKKDMFEVSQVITGKMSRAFYRARDLGKEYYPSLAALAKSRQEEEA